MSIGTKAAPGSPNDGRQDLHIGYQRQQGSECETPAPTRGNINDISCDERRAKKNEGDGEREGKGRIERMRVCSSRMRARVRLYMCVRLRRECQIYRAPEFLRYFTATLDRVTSGGQLPRPWRRLTTQRCHSRCGSSLSDATRDTDSLR